MSSVWMRLCSEAGNAAADDQQDAEDRSGEDRQWQGGPPIERSPTV